MPTTLSMVSILVKDYDEAIHFYTTVLGFKLIEDTSLSNVKRWVRIQAPGNNAFCLLLAKAHTERQLETVGNQSGGRVFIFLNTDNLSAMHQKLIQHAVEIVRQPTVESYGKVLVFADLYGNLWDLIEPTPLSIINETF